MKISVITEVKDREITVFFDCSAGHPGRLSGPPEKCFPPEPPEAEFDHATWVRTGRRLTEMEIDILLSDDLMEALSIKALEQIDEGEDFDEGAYEDWAEGRER